MRGVPRLALPGVLSLALRGVLWLCVAWRGVPTWLSLDFLGVPTWLFLALLGVPLPLPMSFRRFCSSVHVTTWPRQLSHEGH
jgi:hypothetical protein